MTIGAAWMHSAKERWPEVEVAPPLFAEYLATRLDGPSESWAALRGDDLYLACACALGNEAALAIFESEILPSALRAVRRMDVTPAFVAEVGQELRVRLFVGEDKRINQYRGRASLAAWTRIAAVRMALNARRAEKPERRARLSSELPPPSGDAELDLLKARYRPDFSVAVRAAVAQLDPEARSLLRLHFLEGVSLPDLARLYQVHRATVARRIALARESVFDATRHALQERLRVSASEFESLLRLVRSDLDVRLRELL